ncbi:MAG: molybdate ABC transporter substrate-binding protein [Gammaproteobacteria bacterium]
MRFQTRRFCVYFVHKGRTRPAPTDLVRKAGMRHGFLSSLLAAGTLCLAGLAPLQAAELTLALANSTCPVMNKVIEAYRTRSNDRFTLICKSSGLLAKGLHGGALHADIFLSADREWMDFAMEKGLVAANRVTSPWSNVLIVAVPKASPIQRLDWNALATDRVGVLLIGDPSNAPFGRHAKEALEAAGLWDKVRHKIETRKNIELLGESLAAAGPSTVGILFRTNLSDRLRPLFTVNPALHAPIHYAVAPLKASAERPEVAAFLEFLHGKTARDIFRADGFSVNTP